MSEMDEIREELNARITTVEEQRNIALTDHAVTRGKLAVAMLRAAAATKKVADLEAKVAELDKRILELEKG